MSLKSTQLTPINKAVEEFPQFESLPPELRIMIWKLAAISPRCIEIIPSELRRSHHTTLQSPTPVPALMHVNSEARQICLGFVEPFHPEGTQFTGTYCSYERDYFLFNSVKSINFLYRRLSTDLTAPLRVQKAVFNLASWGLFECQGRHLKQKTAIKEAYVGWRLQTDGKETDVVELNHLNGEENVDGVERSAPKLRLMRTLIDKFKRSHEAIKAGVVCMARARQPATENLMKETNVLVLHGKTVILSCKKRKADEIVETDDIINDLPANKR